MKRIIYIVVIAALLGYTSICAAMYFFQRSLLYYPQPRAVSDAGSTMTLQVIGAEIVITTRPLSGSKAIIYFGGNAEDVSLNLSLYAQAFPDQALYFMHYRGYGGSTGRPTEKDNVADGLLLFDRVHALHREVAIVGRSLGSGVAVQVAARVEASRLVLITPFDSIVGIAAQAYPLLPVRWLILDSYESSNFAPYIRIPTSIIEAEYDTVIPHNSTEKLIGRFKSGVVTKKLIAGAGHNNLSESRQYLAALQAALQ